MLAALHTTQPRRPHPDLGTTWDARRSRWVALAHRYIFPADAFTVPSTACRFAFVPSKSHDVLFSILSAHDGDMVVLGEENPFRVPLPVVGGAGTLHSTLFSAPWSGSAPSSPPPPLFSDNILFH